MSERRRPGKCSHIFGRAQTSASFDCNQGPQSKDELLAWDDRYANVAKTAGLAMFVLEMVDANGGGTLITTDYYGFDFPRESLRILVPKLAAVAGIHCPEVRFVRSCDWGEAQAKVLVAQSLKLDSGVGCVFGDLNERLHPDAREWLDIVSPKKKTDKALAKKANNEIRGFLDRGSSWIIRSDAMSRCMVHDCMCPAYATFAWKQQLQQRALLEEGGKACSGSGSGTCGSGGDGHISSGRIDGCALESTGESASKRGRQSVQAARPTAWWQNMVDAIGDDDYKPPLCIAIAGITCTDYTSLGKQFRDAGVHERHAYAWLSERKELAKRDLEDLFFAECSKHYPAEAKQGVPLAETHRVIAIRTGPLEQGIPIKRLRTFSAGINLAKYVWVGHSSPDQIQADFERLFHSTAELTGDVFFHASDAKIQEFINLRLCQRRRPSQPGFANLRMQDILSALVPAGVLQRKQVYDGLWEDGSALSGSFFADLEQNAFVGCNPGPVVPSLNTHPEMYSYAQGRLAVPAEYFGMQGVDCMPTFASSERGGVSPVMACLAGLNEKAVNELAGNGIHITVFASFFIYIMGNIKPRDVCLPASLDAVADGWADSGADQADDSSLPVDDFAE